MARVTPVLWTQKKNKKGHSPIYLRIEANNKRKYVSLRTSILESQWNDKTRRVRKGHKNHEGINNLIAQRIAEAEAEILKLRTDRAGVTVDTLKDSLKEEQEQPAEDFFAYADKIIDEFQRREKLHTYKRYKSIIKKFRAYAGESLPFDKMTPRLFREYETHLIEHHGNNTNTIAANFNGIRSILYRAIREGMLPQSENPFFQFKVKEGKTSRQKLTLEEVQRIEGLDLQKDTLLWHVRNYFFFSFYCAGIRFGDLARLTWDQIKNKKGESRLVYAMSKTEKQKSIKLLPQALSILAHYDSQNYQKQAKYIFPILEGYDISTAEKELNAISNQNALINKYLKKIADKAEVDCKLSFHVSRHSFADVARQKGMSIYNISKALGHSSIKVTENYLRGFDADSLDAEMDDVFN